MFCAIQFKPKRLPTNGNPSTKPDNNAIQEAYISQNPFNGHAKVPDIGNIDPASELLEHKDTKATKYGKENAGLP